MCIATLVVARSGQANKGYLRKHEHDQKRIDRIRRDRFWRGRRRRRWRKLNATYGQIGIREVSSFKYRDDVGARQLSFDRFKILDSNAIAPKGAFDVVGACN